MNVLMIHDDYRIDNGVDDDDDTDDTDDDDDDDDDDFSRA
jgi:hypothetical protein